jgi:hypothetical protein
MTVFELYLICHLVGDYLFQNNWMALKKSNDITPLAIHSLIYASVFGLVFLNFMVFIFFFCCHLGLDTSWGTSKETLTEKWLHLIKGRSLKSTQNITLTCSNSPSACSLYIAFSSVVYCIVDFLLHFFIQYPILLILIN